MIKVWDPLVRIFHWALVATVAIAWLTAEEVEAMHVWVGYCVAALVGFRLVWGLIGPRYARFAQFLPGPTRLTGYVRSMLGGREPRFVGHNPAGGVMIVALLATLLVTAWTGWLMESAPFPVAQAMSLVVGPAYADDDDARRDEDGESGPEWAEDVHEAAANLLLLLIALHVAGVVWSSLHTRENLVRAMFTGRKRAPEPQDVG